MIIGFIGLGVMGKPMSSHLVKAGYELHMFDLDSQVVSQHVQSLNETAGFQLAHAHEGPLGLKTLSLTCDIIITMLPDGEAVSSVCEALEPGLRRGSLVLDCSSSQPWLTEKTYARLQTRGASMVDAAVSGAAWGAEAAELVFMAGGSDVDLARVRPLLEVMGRKIFHVGPLASGHTMKCLNNMITALTLSATTEGLLIGQKAGLDVRAMVQVLKHSTGQSWICDTQFDKRIFSGQFDDPFRLALMSKDLDIATRLARAVNANTPLADLGSGLFAEANVAAGAQASLSEFVRWMESSNGETLGR